MKTIYILNHLDFSDYHTIVTTIAASEKKEVLEQLILDYPAIRDEFLDWSQRLYDCFVKQNKNQFKLKPFIINYKKEFWPATNETFLKNIDQKLYRLDRKRSIVFEELKEKKLDEIGYPFISKILKEDEEYVILELPVIG